MYMKTHKINICNNILPPQAQHFSNCVQENYFGPKIRVKIKIFFFSPKPIHHQAFQSEFPSRQFPFRKYERLETVLTYYKDPKHQNLLYEKEGLIQEICKTRNCSDLPEIPKCCWQIGDGD